MRPSIALQRTPAAPPPSPRSAKTSGRLRTLAAGAAVLATTTCAGPDVQARIQQLAGGRAKDCGHVAEANWKTVQPCILDSFTRRQAFYVRYDLKGIDSWCERVYVGTDDARCFELLYDSDVRGTGSWWFAKPRLLQRPRRP